MADESEWLGGTPQEKCRHMHRVFLGPKRPRASVGSSSSSQPTREVSHPPQETGPTGLPQEGASGSHLADSGEGLFQERVQEVVAYFQEPRHRMGMVFERDEVIQWRMRERLKTSNVALVLCLNIGVDPPDVVKLEPCARLECWIDPYAVPPTKALESIGNQLKQQYERWQPRARYKPCLDPTSEEVKKTCTHLRRQAKEERVLFHYNGHGVPRPTANGELWVFNKNYTQYIPLSLYDLNLWLSPPAIYVFDCGGAGHLLHTFAQIQEQRDSEGSSSTGARNPSRENIVLAACGADESLPTNHHFPADLFTSCLTTPIQIALKWFVLNNRLLSSFDPEMVDRLPGRINDRRTPMGELNWIFTAITDTIAWNALPKDLFQKLFRQDLLVAALFRNFLLAERIMRSVNCTPCSLPALPPTHNHPLWEAWDLAVDTSLSQLLNSRSNLEENFEHSTFFSDQLSAFEMWLDYGSHEKRKPEQLPIVLQVLLSQTHRLRALMLLSQFLDLGAWAVNLALSVGIFPYVLKLLQSNAQDLRPALVFIWAKILALDKSCQADLVKDQGHLYFIRVLSNLEVSSRQRVLACFILSVIVDGHPMGQTVCMNANLLGICTQQLNDPDPLLRRWLLLTVAKLLENYEEAKQMVLANHVQQDFAELLVDRHPEVRAASVYTLASILSAEPSQGEVNHNHRVITLLMQMSQDGSPLVRREVAFSLATFSKFNFKIMQRVGRRALLMELGSQWAARPSHRHVDPSADGDEDDDIVREQLMKDVWSTLRELSNDGIQSVKRLASDICNYILGDEHEFLDVSKNLPKSSTLLGGIRESSSSPSLASSSSISSLASSSKKGGSSSGGGRSGGSTPTQYHDEATRSRKHRGGRRRFESGAGGSAEETEEEDIPVSDLYDWSADMFCEPMLRKEKEVEEEEANQRGWRIKTADAFMETTLREQHSEGIHKIDEQLAFLETSGEVGNVIFHPYISILYSSSDVDVINVWNWTASSQVNVFRNSSSRYRARITSMHVINELESSPLLLVGSEDGLVRVWKDLELAGRQEVVAGWCAAPELNKRSTDRSGLLCGWFSRLGQLCVAGEMGFIKIWDAANEICLQNVLTMSEKSTTALACRDEYEPCISIGCSDGTVRSFDLRTPTTFGPSQTFHGHKGSIVKVQLETENEFEMVSACTDGQVRMWDIRNGQCLSALEVFKHRQSAFASHSHERIFASGSSNQFIKVFDAAGTTLSMIYYHDGFLGQRMGPISCLAFHPCKMVLAAGATDGIISIYR